MTGSRGCHRCCREAANSKNGRCTEEKFGALTSARAPTPCGDHGLGQTFRPHRDLWRPGGGPQNRCDPGALSTASCSVLPHRGDLARWGAAKTHLRMALVRARWSVRSERRCCGLRPRSPHGNDPPCRDCTTGAAVATRRRCTSNCWESASVTDEKASGQREVDPAGSSRSRSTAL